MKTNYLEEFLQAFSLGIADPINAVFDSRLNASDFQKVADAGCGPKLKAEIESLKNLSQRVDDLRGQIGTETTSKCHVACSNLFNSIKLRDDVLPGLASITIGDVELDGQPLYGCTAQSISDELTNPSKDNPNLAMHFWITCLDMTIIDFALPYNLQEKGRNDIAELMMNPYICDPSRSNNLVSYRPMVVDNDGPGKVDELRSIT